MSVMPEALRYERPADLAKAQELLKHDGAIAMAGGQSLIAAMKLGLNESTVLVDLQAIPSLQGIELQGKRLIIGAMTTHAQIAASPIVAQFSLGLSELANGIADQQVRNMGTIGGSLANNDPAACWPAAVLAAQAIVVTTDRRISADEFFKGVYATALKPQELILAIEWPSLAQFVYKKFEQKASRFAMVGVALAKIKEAKTRVAITGLGHGVLLWSEASDALTRRFSIHSLDTLYFPESSAQTDLHASAAYRAHLVHVLTHRSVAQISKENSAPAVMKYAQNATDLILSAASQNPAGNLDIQGQQHLHASVERVWQALFDPAVLQNCIAGCESFKQISPTAYAATIKVGLGPVSARFQVDVLIQNIYAPQSCTLVFVGNAGALGSGQGRAHVTLRATHDGSTHLIWQTQSRVNGRLAQLGSRLISASVNKLSGDFFLGLSRQILGQSTIEAQAGWWRAFMRWFMRNR
jgi:CO/xanthine dehydrogenase FAD-binding subunit/carbon monoxide dehydrogenase subunit G